MDPAEIIKDQNFRQGRTANKLSHYSILWGNFGVDKTLQKRCDIKTVFCHATNIGQILPSVKDDLGIRVPNIIKCLVNVGSATLAKLEEQYW